MASFSRKKTRELVMQLLFQAEIQNSFKDEDAKTFFEENIRGRDNKAFAYDLFYKTRDNLLTIDDLINRFSIRWSVKRMPKIDLAIMRLAIAEILYKSDVPDKVSINEAIELAKSFGTDKSAKFINGILGQIMEYKNGKRQ